MRFFFKIPEFPKALFVSASLISFFVVFLVFILITTLYREMKSLEKYGNSYQFNEAKVEQFDPLTTKVPELKGSLKAPIVTGKDPQIGNPDAKARIVLFSDFECDFCKEQESEIKKILEEFPEDVRLVWKDFPDTDEGSKSFKSSIAARCAQEQDKFWEYHDQLFADKIINDEAGFLEIAQRLKLNRNTFKKCLDSDRPKKAVRESVEEASALSLGGIPHLFINGQEFFGGLRYDELKLAVKKELLK